MSAATPSKPATGRHRPKSFTVFAAAFIAGAAAAVGVNRVLDVQLAQRRPQVECEPIFVALRSLPQGSPVTVWDVALKDWPKAMLPGSALRASDSFEGFVLRHAIREGQPLLAVQLVRSDATGRSPGTSIAAESFTAPVPATQVQQPPTTTQADLWTPAETAAALIPKTTVAAARQPQMAVAVAPKSVVEPPMVATEPTPAEPTVGETDGDAGASSTAAVPAALPQATATMAASSPMPPSPTDIEPPAMRGRPTPAQPQPQPQPEKDPVTEAVVTDVASMPSVMTRSSGTSQPAGKSSGGGDAGRYLVVPERIALQADTSFTTPRPQPPGPPSAPAARTAQTQSQPPASASTPAARTTSAPSQQRQRQAATAGGQAAGRRSQQPTQQPSQQQPGSRNRQTSAASPQRSWSGMFPNMAAGVEALGSAWQKPKADSGSPQASTRR